MKNGGYKVKRDDRDTPLYMIGIVAQMLSIHPQTLRLYEREGLLMPGRSHGKTRLYSPRDVERVEFILHLTREMGVNLAGVEVILRMREQIDRMQREMEGLIGYLRDELKKEIVRFEGGAPAFKKAGGGQPRKKVEKVRADERKGGRG